MSFKIKILEQQMNLLCKYYCEETFEDILTHIIPFLHSVIVSTFFSMYLNVAFQNVLNENEENFEKLSQRFGILSK